MIISQNQLLELDKIKLDEFLHRVIRHARVAFGSNLKDPDEVLYDKFEKWFYDAKKYHITKETDVFSYLELCLVSDELASEEKPRWMLMVLNKKSISAEKKMERIYNRIMEEAGI